jgi:ribosome hibernation promoting factor
MHVAIRINDTDLAEALRSYVGRRLRFALGRFGNRVRQVTVRIGGEGRSEVADGSLPRLPFGRVAVEESDPNLFAVIDRATGRIGHLFGRELQRTRDSRLGRELVRLAA